MAPARWLARAGLAVTLACTGPFEPDVGPPLRAACTDEDSNPDEDVSFRDDIVPRVLRASATDCSKCHTPDGATPIGIEVGGLDLSTYASLRRGGINSGSDIVVAGQPCDSILWQKLVAPPFGARMPLDGPPFGGDDVLELLRDWIAEGARDN
jgi:hypothetical protein